MFLVKQCPDLSTHFSNGSIEFIQLGVGGQTHSPGAQCQFTCNPGYELVGIERANCHEKYWKDLNENVIFF